ncbi:hypothetical protein NG799_25825 [Laspinema sp. D1]|uniref:Uncharacterized protein n=1 Tax=Laspinema palackyanum D2a TaxID=2953684 RepID=A0ABT2N0R9_9CYAN|nr:hypothetical protein [Laspinema sp. D2a]
MKLRTLIHSGVAILIGATVGIVNIPSVLDSGKIAQVAVAAEPYPQADENGDYYIVNGQGSGMPYEWEVVDPDPNGLNCRELDRSARNINDIYNFPIRTALPTGERISSPRINLDDRGLPWLWVGSSATRYPCFVRANSRFVRPIRPLPKPF